MRFGVARDTLEKAAPGSVRGFMHPNWGREKRGHKYIRRVRVWYQGRARWKYYYRKETLPQVRAEAEEAARKRTKLFEGVTGEGGARAAQREAEELHRPEEDLAVEMPHIRPGFKPLRSLSQQAIQALVPGDRKPEIEVAPGILGKYHDALLDKQREDEPEGLLGKPMSPLRALELALGRVPPTLMRWWAGSLKSVKFVESQDDAAFQSADGKNLVSYSTGRGNIVVAVDRAGFLANSGEARMRGGLFPVESILREIAHTVWARMGSGRPAGHTGPWAEEWANFIAGAGKGEPGVTVLAEQGPEERFIESLTAATMFPTQLATTAPKTYDWIRDFLGGAIPLRATDQGELGRLREERAAQVKAKATKEALADLDRKIDAVTGLDRIPDDDGRLAWWRPGKQENHVQRLFRLAEKPNYAKIERFDPADMDKLGDTSHDRFFEWSAHGRTVYMRVGPVTGKDGFQPCEWQPDDPESAELFQSQIKEMYTEDGVPLKTYTAWWWLNQDLDNPKLNPDVRGEGQRLDSLDTRVPGGLLVSRGEQWILNILRNQAAGKKAAKGIKFGKEQASAMLPDEISFREFRLRSGTTAWDQWQRGGEDLIKQLSHIPVGDPDRAEIMERLKKAQPYMKITQDVDEKTGRVLRTVHELTSVPEEARERMGYGPHPVPQFWSVNYENPNPDGSRSIIRVDQDTSPGLTHGQYFIADPALRALLTPGGEAVNSPQDLVDLSRLSADKGRTAWVSVLIEPKKSGDLPAYHHVKVKYDGRGSPLVLGDQWKQITGRDQPRLEDLLRSSAKEGEAEISRARILGPAVKLIRPRAAKKTKIPEIGDRVILNVRGAEVGQAEDGRAMVELRSVVPDEEGKPQYVFEGVQGSRYAGRTFVRHGERGVLHDITVPTPTVVPDALDNALLGYVYRRMDPISGAWSDGEMRLKLPKDGSISEFRLLQLPGVKKTDDGDFRVDLDSFHRLREDLGTLVMTADAESMLHGKVLNANHDARTGGKDHHEFDIVDLGAEKIASWVPGVRTQFPDGSKIRYGKHQREALQFIFDHEQRALIAHSPGLGKTPTALIAAKLAMARKDPADPSKPHPLAPKKVLFIVPLQTLDGWKADIEAFDGGATIVGTRTTDVPLRRYLEDVKSGANKSGFVVMGKELWSLRDNYKHLLEAGFDGIVADEVQEGVKNEVAEINKKLHAWNPQMKMMLFLSGTPVTNSAADAVDYVKLLSKGRIWHDLDKKSFTENYLMEHPATKIVGARHVQGKGPRTEIRPEKVNEVTSVLGQVMHVALPKDATDKVLPPVRLDDSDNGLMIGVQAALFSAHIARMSDLDRELIHSGAITSEEETRRLSANGQHALYIAKQISNTPAYKPESSEEFVTYERTVPGKTKGTFSTVSEALETPDLVRLMDPKRRGKGAGKWPTVDEIGGQEAAALYGLHFADVLGTHDYTTIAGKRISKEQLERARAAGWTSGNKIRNPDQGPLGIRCRGTSTYTGMNPDFDRAAEVQRAFAEAIRTGIEEADPLNKKRRSYRKLKPAEAMTHVATQFSISEDEVDRLMHISPYQYEHKPVAEYGGVTVREGEEWVADKKGNLYLIYKTEDWDRAKGRPREAGRFDSVKDGDLVEVEGFKWPLDPETKQPVTGGLRYDASFPEEHGKVTVVDTETDERHLVDPAKIVKPVKSTMDPGMRSERAKADVTMVVGSAKAKKFMERIDKFFNSHADTNGERQMVAFARDILSGCRSMEAALRLSGFMDVNEAIEGSPHYDSADPRAKTGAPAGKYFVTYIGSTVTGDRALNSEIFRRVPDRLGRPTATSMFTARTENGAKWHVYSGDTEDFGVKKSRWSPKERERIFRQFKIKTPVAFVNVDGEQRYFYGNKESARIERQLDPRETPDPTTVTDPAEAERTRKKISDLKRRFAEIAKTEAVSTPPLTTKQREVFNNVTVLVASDAANTGVSWGNATESYQYDAIASAADKQQRIARVDRLLSKPIVEELWGTEAAPGPFLKIKQREPAIFKPVKRLADMDGLISQGEVMGTPLAGPTALGSVLSQIAHKAAMGEADARSSEERKAWAVIRGRAEAARAFGAQDALAALEEFKTLPTPGTAKPVLAYAKEAAHIPDPTAGTYDQIRVAEPVAAIQGAIDALPESDKRALVQEGFGKGNEVDATEVYLALRSQQILDYIQEQTPKVGAAMRSSPVGAAVTDNDIDRAVIDSLSPEDRAILKSKNYLKNAYQLTTSAAIPVFVTTTVEETGPDGEVHTRRQPVFAGYEIQSRIQPEEMARAVSRARQVPVETLMRRIQEGVEIHNPLEYQQTTPEFVAGLSRLHKALRAIPAVRMTEEFFRG